MKENLRPVDDFNLDEVEAIVEYSRRDAKNKFLARSLCFGLSLELLSEGLRHFGRWANQLKIGRLCILFVVLDPDDLQYAQRHKQFLNRLRLLRK